MSSSDRPIKPESINHAIVIGRVFVDRNPLSELKRLQASIGYSTAVGYFIPVREDDMRRIRECIAFNEGRES